MRQDNKKLKKQLEAMLAPKQRVKVITDESEMDRNISALKGNPFAKSKNLWYIVEGYRVND